MAPHEREERRFLRQAAAATRFQADAARLALKKATSPGVRSLATTLVERQAVSGNELLHMLHQRGMAAPMLENDQRKTLNRLAKMQGRKFEREFIDHVAMRSQREEVDSYQKASQSVQDPALKDWIARSLPTLRSELAGAERVAIPESHTARASGHSSVARGRALRQSAGHSLPPAAAR
jgi:predicted outer membrane protein